MPCGGFAPVDVTAAAPAAGAAASEAVALVAPAAPAAPAEPAAPAAPAEPLDALRRWACCGNVYAKHDVACSNCGTAAPPEGERRALPKPRVKWAETGNVLRYDPALPVEVVPKKRPKTTERAQGNLPP